MSDLLITVLAEGPANTGPDFGKASPVGLLVVVLLLIGLVLLVLSMNRHIKRVPESFDGTADQPAEAGESSSDPERRGESGG